MFNSVVFLHRTVSSGLWRVVGCSLYLVSFLKRIESELFYFVSIHHTETVMYKNKFKRAFFRHDRWTAPKFGTHVRIETRLALTKNKLTNPTPEGFRGLFIASCRSSVRRPFVRACGMC